VSREKMMMMMMMTMTNEMKLMSERDIAKY